MALEKGPGVKQELLFASPHNLFKSTVVLAFEVRRHEKRTV